MINPRLIDLAKRRGNEELPKERAVEPKVEPVSVGFPDLPSESFLFSYDGPHKDFFQELITKANAGYAGTSAEIPTGTTGEVQGHLIKRMGLISTIADDPNLRSANLLPITATQSEHLLKNGKLPNSDSTWEDFGMVLYDRSQNGCNPQESQALYDSLMVHRTDLGLSKTDLENRFVVVNPGAEIDSSMPYGVKPIIIPGITQVYQHEVLEKVGEDSVIFDGYGLSGGLPLLSQLGSGSRTLYMPGGTENIGLRLLFRYRSLNLNARIDVLTNSISDGRVNFARQGTN